MTPTTKTAPDNLPRVIRGGGWCNYDPAWVRATIRYPVAPTNRGDDLGFRCALRVREPRT